MRQGTNKPHCRGKNNRKRGYWPPLHRSDRTKQCDLLLTHTTTTATPSDVAPRVLPVVGIAGARWWCEGEGRERLGASDRKWIGYPSQTWIEKWKNDEDDGMQSTNKNGDKAERIWCKAMEWDTRVRGMIGRPNPLVGKEVWWESPRGP